MMALEEIKIEHTITKEELRQAQEEVDRVKITPEIIHVLTELRSKLRKEGYIFSPRRWRESKQVLRAHAWFHGRDEVSEDDLEILAAVLWDRPEQRREVLRILMSTTNPDTATALALFDDIQEIIDDIEKQPDESAKLAASQEAVVKLRDMIPLFDNFRPHAKIFELKNQAIEMQRAVVRRYFGININ